MFHVALIKTCALKRPCTCPCTLTQSFENYSMTFSIYSLEDAGGKVFGTKSFSSLWALGLISKIWEIKSYLTQTKDHSFSWISEFKNYNFESFIFNQIEWPTNESDAHIFAHNVQALIL